jgi:Derlin-2/3
MVGKLIEKTAWISYSLWWCWLPTYFYCDHPLSCGTGVDRMIQITAGYYLGAYLLLNPLILALAYSYSQDNPTSMVSFYIINFQAKYLPYALILMTFITGGPDHAKVQITGLLAAHLYDFLTRIWPQFGGGRNYIVTPDFVKRWFGGDAPAPQIRNYGTAFAARPEAPPRNPAWTNQRGPGRRLGGE